MDEEDRLERGESRKDKGLVGIGGSLQFSHKGGRAFELFDKGRARTLTAEERIEYMRNFADEEERYIGKPMFEMNAYELLQLSCYSVNNMAAKLTKEERAAIKKPCRLCRGKRFTVHIDGDQIIAKDCFCRGKDTDPTHKEEYEKLTTCTFERFRINEPWQREELRKVKVWLAQNRYPFLFIGGKTGTGKTHLAFAAYGILLKRGIGGEYIPWRTAAKDLKERLKDYVEYGDARISELKSKPLLLLDDALGFSSGGFPEDDDFRLLKELVEARARNGLRTIITSSFRATELYGVSKAIGDVIGKACGGTQNFAIEVEQTVNGFDGSNRAQKFSVHDIERGDYAPFA